MQENTESGCFISISVKKNVRSKGILEPSFADISFKKAEISGEEAG